MKQGTPRQSDSRAFWVTGPNQGEIRDEKLPPLPDGWVRVRTCFSGISRGTEGLVYRGEVPSSEHQRMRAPFQGGDLPAPVKYGYINVGEVEFGPAELVGRMVFCLYPHQTRWQLPADAVHPLPEHLPPGRAVLAANLETAINALWDAAPRLGDRIGVVGGGTLGCLAAWLAVQIPGCRVELIDVNPRRAVVADRLGVPFRAPADATPDADLLIHASGAAAGLSTALELAGFEATVLELSWFGSQPVTLPLGQAFHQRRLTLRSSQVGSIATAQRARWDFRRRMQLALSLLGDDKLDALITGEDPFDDLPRVQARLAADPGDTLMHRIRYD
jgi:threonine dehydrogenase-like Zn-dependent dehydrogenase